MRDYCSGAAFPSEYSLHTDPQTGARIHQVTAAPCINHHLYFLTPSFTPDQRHIIFASYRSGRPEYFSVEFPDGPIRQLTDEPGIHGYSGAVSGDGSELFYTAGCRVRAVHLTTLATRTVADFGKGQLGECSISADGRWIVSALKRDGRSHVTVTATDDSRGSVIYSRTGTIIHPQFHPADLTLIEYAGDPAPRMWTIRRDGSENQCLYEHGDDEFLVHETFLGDGAYLIFTVWPYALKRMRLADRAVSTIADFNAWHIAGSRDGTMVLCDTVHPDLGIQLVSVETGVRRTVCHPGSSCGGSQWKKDRYAVAADWEAARLGDDKSAALSWMEMKVDTIYGPQWTHPHPSFSPDERMVAYTSDVTGHPQVYVAEVG